MGRFYCAALALVFVAIASPVRAADLWVMSGGAPKQVLNDLVQRFEKLTGHHVKVTYHLVSGLRQKILGGSNPDVVIIPTTALDNLVAAGKISRDGVEQLGTVKLVAIVRENAPQPDISTTDNFRNALLNAKSVVYATPGSTQIGAHMANLVSQLDITEAVERKAIYRPSLEGGVTMVAQGKADLGIYPASEVVNVKGVTSLGTLPDQLQYPLTYVGAITTKNRSPEPALALIHYLGSAENRPVWQQAGFSPPSADR